MPAPKPPVVAETNQTQPETEPMPNSTEVPPTVADSQSLEVPTIVPGIHEDAPQPAQSIQSSLAPELPRETIPEIQNVDRSFILENPPGNWSVSPGASSTEIYSHHSSSIPKVGGMFSPTNPPKVAPVDPIVGTVPKGRFVGVHPPPGPPPMPVMITVPLPTPPMGRRINPHSPPPRITVPVPKMMYSAPHKLTQGAPQNLFGLPYLQQADNPSL